MKEIFKAKTRAEWTVVSCATRAARSSVRSETRLVPSASPSAARTSSSVVKRRSSMATWRYVKMGDAETP